MHLENTLVMHGVYNAEMLERLIKQYTYYIADKQCTKAYWHKGHLCHINIIDNAWRMRCTPLCN